MATRLLVVSLAALGLTAGPAFAQVSNRCAEVKPSSRDLSALDLESLLKLKVITASKSLEAISDAPGVISVVTHDELRQFGAMTLREVLARVPGLSETTAYFTDRSLVAARGDQTKIDGGHLLILINGRPSREVLEGGIVSDLLESFPVGALERVEVVNGPGSVLYGSNAFSAVINLITVKPESNGYTVTGLPAPAGGLATSGQATIRCGDLSILGSAQLRRQPDWNTTYRVPTSFIADPRWPATPSVQAISIPDRGAGGYLGVSFKNLSVMSSWTEWETSSFVRGSVGDSRWKRGFADVGYSFKGNDNWDSTINLTYTRNTFGVDQYPSIGRDSHEVVLEWSNTMRPTSRDQLTFGTLYSHIEGQEIYYGLTPSITISDGHRSAGAWYGQVAHRLVDSVKLIGGLQANKIGDLDLDVVPRAGAIWHPARLVAVKALYSEAFRAPSINETHLNHPGLAGTPGLRPEKVGTFDLGLTYEGSRAQAGVNFFHSRQTDSIIVDTQPVQWRYTNLGGVTFRGFELDGKWYVRKSLFLFGSMLHQSHEDTSGVFGVTAVPDTSMKAGLSIEGPRGLTASLFDTYQGAIPGYVGASNPTPDARHLLNGQARLDVSRFLGAGMKQGLALVVHAENLANTPVWLPDWGDNIGDTIPANRGRTIYVGVELSSVRSAHASRP